MQKLFVFDDWINFSWYALNCIIFIFWIVHVQT